MQCVLPLGPLELVAVDLVGPLLTRKGGLKHIFVVLDTFTKYVKFYSIKSIDLETVEKKMIQIILRKWVI